MWKLERWKNNFVDGPKLKLCKRRMNRTHFYEWIMNIENKMHRKFISWGSLEHACKCRHKHKQVSNINHRIGTQRIGINQLFKQQPSNDSNRNEWWQNLRFLFKGQITDVVFWIFVVTIVTIIFTWQKPCSNFRHIVYFTLTEFC